MKFPLTFQLLSVVYLGCATTSAQLTVSTQQGLVVGTLVGPTVRQFLGIPFATAKRWEAPQAPPARSGLLLANKFGDSCYQNLVPTTVKFLELVGGAGLNNTASENCNTVNIWAPSITRKQKTAVMIWIYGGGFVFGTSNIPGYVGANFVKDNDDLTIVTFNYRLNIFGQPNAPQLGANNRNFGLLDIDAVVKWVYANIANFGGDPERITLFGQSAGSAATDAYTFAHPDDTIVKGIIQQSGSISGGALLVPPPTNSTPWNTVASAVGCGAANTPEQFTCMQVVSAKTLQDAVISTGAGFTPVVDNTTIFPDTQARAAAGNFLKVPLLGGTTQNEDDIFLVAQQLVATGVVVPTITETLSDILTLLGFTCPAGVTALNRINAKVPTWRYLYQAVFQDISSRSELRAYHASEIPIIFGTYDASPNNIEATPAEIALSRYVQKAWVAFARNPKQGLIDFGWPLYNPTTPTLAQLGNPANETGVVFTKGALVDFACAKRTTLAQISALLTSVLGA